MYSWLVLVSVLGLYDTVTMRYERDKHRNIVTKSKIELSPILITCGLQDIAIISAPVVNCQEVAYRLYKPNGDAATIDFTRHKPNINKPNLDATQTYSSYRDDVIDFWSYDELVVKYINRDIKTIYPRRNYKVINANFVLTYAGSDNIVDDAERNMRGNEFMMGPLSEEDHGNWVLSVYCKDIDEKWVEIFQVITITIIDTVLVVPGRVTLKEGSTFNLSFAYPIKGLETCELIAPKSTFDRYFDKSRIELDTCGYVVTNVSKSDAGPWTVVGVGKIVYEGIVNLDVDDNKVT